MFVVTVSFEIHSDDMYRFLENVSDNALQSLKREPGCQVFDICVDTEDPSHVLLYEVYKNEKAFSEHLQSEHFRNFDQAVGSMVRSKSVRTYYKSI